MMASALAVEAALVGAQASYLSIYRPKPPAMSKAERLKVLALAAYCAASNPTEAKMAGILLDLFAPEYAE